MKEKVVLGEFPMFMALRLRGGPVNAKEATKKKKVYWKNHRAGRLQDTGQVLDQ